MEKETLREKFTDFERLLKENLADLIAEILCAKERVTYIGFVTTDDFYGAFVTWNQPQQNNIWEHFEWGRGLGPNYLYQPLVDVVESNEQINLMESSPEKWRFAEALMDVFHDQLNQLPDTVFMNAGYKRDELIFFMTMSDGDYMDEMIIASVESWNSEKAIQNCLSTGWKAVE